MEITRKKRSTNAIIDHLRRMIPEETSECVWCGWISLEKGFLSCCICTESICSDCAFEELQHGRITCCNLDDIAFTNMHAAVMLILAAFRPRFGRDIAKLIGRYIWYTRKEDIWWEMSTQDPKITQ